MIVCWLHGLRGFACVALLSTLAGGIPGVVRLGLAVAAGAWTALSIGPLAPNTAAWSVALHEVSVGATLGLLAALPAVAVTWAGRLVDQAARTSPDGPYRRILGVLGAAVFVAIDGHVTVLTSLMRSFLEVPGSAVAQPRVLASLAALAPAATHLALPWVVTAATVELGLAVALRLGEGTAGHIPVTAVVRAAIVVITAALLGTVAVAIAAITRAMLAW